MIKKIQIELVIIAILFLNIFITSGFEIDFLKKFNSFGLDLSNQYFKDFFIKITELGNSLWFFLISFLTYMFCFLFEKINKKKLFISKLKTISLFLFISVFITGALTQIIKHLVGRPRPNYVNEENYLGINFFNFDSAFHSFPSGHTSTIFTVALVLSCVTPKIKYFYLFFAFLVGLSRFIVGAHYFSDIIAGIAVAFIGLKLTLWLLNKPKSKKKVLNIIKFDPSIFFLTLIIFLITVVFLTIGSSADIFMESLFYKGNQVFILQNFSYITILAREIFLPFLVLYILIIPILSLYFPINKIYFDFKFNLKKIIFLWGSVVFNILIVINLFLKSFWGRARPNEIFEFGGEKNFTPWFQTSDSCVSNCSFVSGDASVGFSLIGLFFLTNNKNYYWLALLSGFFLGIIRMLEGGHFFSDVIIAGFLIFFLTYIQFLFYRKKFNSDL